MPDELLSAREAARRLGVSATTLYAWLGLSDRGLLVIRGRPVTVSYLQGGPRGQGRIRIEAGEVERVKDQMRVTPEPARSRRPPVHRSHFPGITVPLGRPV
jgi:transposase-like protein